MNLATNVLDGYGVICDIRTENDVSGVCVQSDSVFGVEQALKEHGIKYTRTTLDEGLVKIEQVFFHDPDGFMIEICTCENFPVQPLEEGALQRTSSICSLAPALSAR